MQKRVHALFRCEALQREHEAVVRRHLERRAHRPAVAGRRRKLHAIHHHLAAAASGAVDCVPTVSGDVGRFAHERDERALPPAPQRRHAGPRNVAAVQREHRRHAERALGHDGGEARRHRIVHVQHVGTRGGDGATHGRHGRHRERRQRAGRPAMSAHAHQRHAVLVPLDGKVHEAVVLRRAVVAVQRLGEPGRQHANVVTAGEASVDLQQHELGAADDGQERRREDEDPHPSTRR